MDTVHKALAVPTRTIADNAGAKGTVVVSKVAESKDPNFGYNALTDEFGDLMAAGRDHAGEGRSLALQNAASVATVLLAADCIITSKPEPKEPRAPARAACPAAWAAWVAWAEWVAWAAWAWVAWAEWVSKSAVFAAARAPLNGVHTWQRQVISSAGAAREASALSASPAAVRSGSRRRRTRRMRPRVDRNPARKASP
jgi:hypothetical protein